MTKRGSTTLTHPAQETVEPSVSECVETLTQQMGYGENYVPSIAVTARWEHEGGITLTLDPATTGTVLGRLSNALIELEEATGRAKGQNTLSTPEQHANLVAYLAMEAHRIRTILDAVDAERERHYSVVSA